VRRKTTLKKKTTGVYREGARDRETRHRHDRNRRKGARGKSQKEVHGEETKESGWKRRTQGMKNESSFWERGKDNWFVLEGASRLPRRTSSAAIASAPPR